MLQDRPVSEIFVARSVCVACIHFQPRRSEMSTAQVEPQANPLAHVDRARTRWPKPAPSTKVKKIRDIAEAARVYAKAAKLGRSASC